MIIFGYADATFPPFFFLHISSSMDRKAMRFEIITGTESLANTVTLRKLL